MIRSVNSINVDDWKQQVHEVVIGSSPIIDHKNCYVATVSFTYGDADGGGSSVVKFAPDKKSELLDLLNFLARVAHQSDDDLGEIEGFEKWTDYGHEKSECGKIKWHSDPSRDGESAGFESVSVHWYDESGLKYPVSLQIEKLSD